MPLLSNDIQLKIQNLKAHWTQHLVTELTERAIADPLPLELEGSDSQNYTLYGLTFQAFLLNYVHS